MILTTGELESAPIIMLRALADDEETWTIEVTVEDETFTGEIEHLDWETVVILDEDGGPLEIPWDEVDKVMVP